MFKEFRWKLFCMQNELKSRVFTFTHKSSYRAANDFCKKCVDQTDWTDELEAAYRRLMKLVMRRWFRVRGDLDMIIEDACEGNWQRLWESDEEKKTKTIADYIDDMCGEVFYCSDRWTWDRFLRTNWMYQRIKYRKLCERLYSNNEVSNENE